MMKVERIVLASYDGLALLVVSLVATACWPTVAYAYVDPSVMTYTIQALAGVAVALSAVLGVALRRTRRILMRLLHIDENAHKQVEPSVHPVDAQGEDGAAALAEADAAARRSRKEQLAGAKVRDLPWPQRLIRAFVASMFLIGTVFIVAPLEVVAGSSSSLLFGPEDVAGLLVVAGLVVSLVMGFVVSAVRGCAFDVVITIIVALGICCYVQAMFLNSSLPIADGRALGLSSYKTITVISTVVWVALIVGLLLLNKKKASLWRVGAMVVCACLIVVQAASVVSLSFPSQEEGGDIVITKEGLFEVGSEDNIVVFVLDTFDTKQMSHLLQGDPSLLDEFTGFTYFENATGSMVPTRYGIPYLLTGIMPDGLQSFTEFMDGWYTQSTLLPDIKEAGYSIGIYSDSVETNYMRTRDIEGVEFVARYADNLKEEGEVSLDPLGALAILDKVALYRDAPWALKPLFWFYTDDVTNGAISKDEKDSTPYVMDDAAYAEELFQRGLAIGDANKALRFIHLNGAHDPYTIDETGHEVVEGVTLDQQCEGSIAMVNAYLKEMKRLGIYDAATIVITADHGDWYLTPDVISEPTTPILLVKPAEDSEEAALPLKVSQVPTGHLDYAATLVDAAGGDASSYGPTVFEVEDGSRLRYYWMTTSDGHNDQQLKEFVIDGHVLDFDNWTLTGNVIEIRLDEIRKSAA